MTVDRQIKATSLLANNSFTTPNSNLVAPNNNKIVGNNNIVVSNNNRVVGNKGETAGRLRWRENFNINLEKGLKFQAHRHPGREKKCDKIPG
jgi:hypothetical protein